MVVINNGNHIGYVIGISDKHIHIFGGNQGDEFNVNSKPIEAVSRYAIPTGSGFKNEVPIINVDFGEGSTL
jgi:hypothetical protein